MHWLIILKSTIQAAGRIDVEDISERFKYIKHVATVVLPMVYKVVKVKEATQRKMREVLNMCLDSVAKYARILDHPEKKEYNNIRKHQLLMRRCSTTMTLFFAYVEVRSAEAAKP